MTFDKEAEQDFKTTLKERIGVPGYIYYKIDDKFNNLDTLHQAHQKECIKAYNNGAAHERENTKVEVLKAVRSELEKIAASNFNARSLIKERIAEINKQLEGE